MEKLRNLFLKYAVMYGPQVRKAVPSWVPLAVVLGIVFFGDALAANSVAANTVADQVTSSVKTQLINIICPVADLLSGPVARLISLVIFVGAIIYYLSNDSRTAKGLALAAVVGLILANTFTAWQELFTGESYDTLCERKAH